MSTETIKITNAKLKMSKSMQNEIPLITQIIKVAAVKLSQIKSRQKKKIKI